MMGMIFILTSTAYVLGIATVMVAAALPLIDARIARTQGRPGAR